MENPLELIKSIQKPTKSDSLISEYILENPVEVVRQNLSSLAKSTKTSNTAIMRFCQKIGYQGFSEFKYDLSRYILSGESSSNQNSENPADISDRIGHITDKYVQYLNRLNTELDIDETKALVKSICTSKRIVILGFNRTGLSAKQLSLRLGKIGIASQSIVDYPVMVDYSSILSKDDLVVVFSISAASMYKDVCKQMKQTGCNVVLITMTPQSNLKNNVTSTIVLPRISRSGDISFLDDQAIFFVLIEILVGETAVYLRKS